jgi:hypothetical protein
VIATRALLGPIALAAIAVLVVNDHVLKAAMPGVVTGKLSDVAGMVFFPLLLAAAAEHAGIRRGTRTIAIAAIATGLVFAAVKLVPVAGDAYRVGLAALQWPFRALAGVIDGSGVPPVGRVHLTADASDLVALPALIVPLLVSRGVTEGDVRVRG